MADGTNSADLFERGLLLRSRDSGKRVASFVASTDDVDSYGTVLDQETWDFARYKRNPVVLLDHDRRKVVGRAIRFEVVRGQLEVDVEFMPEGMSEEADETWAKVDAGFLRGMSVGFEPADIRAEKQNGAEVYRLSGLELYETSIVSIPSNPNTLAKARQRAAAINPPPTKETIMSEQKTLPAIDTTELVNARTAQATAERALEEKTRALVEAEKTIADLRAANVKLGTDHAELVKRHAELESKSQEQEVDALIGKRLTPAQRDAALVMLRANRQAFEAFMATMPDLTALTETRSLITTSVEGKPADTVADAFDRDIAAVSKSRARA